VKVKSDTITKRIESSEDEDLLGRHEEEVDLQSVEIKSKYSEESKVGSFGSKFEFKD